MIFKGKVFIESWFDDLPGEWQFEVSPNGWTSDEISLRWLEKLFIPSTSSQLKGRYRLLILDGHGSHLTPKFDEICEKNDIIPIYMPAHSSHLLQPLDIGCFAVLKRSYGRLVGTKMRNGINHIDKLDFLEAYPSARIEAFKPETIKTSFVAAGLVPFSPDQVISKLDIHLRTPTPPPSGIAIGTQNRLRDYIQLQKQASSIKALLRARSKTPPSPLNSAINQGLKACQITMQSAAFLEKEASDLRAKNEKKKQKRTRSQRKIPSTEGLSVLEASVLFVQPEEAIEPPSPPQPRRPSPPIQPRTRALNRCGACGNLGHKRTACPDRPR